MTSAVETKDGDLNGMQLALALGNADNGVYSLADKIAKAAEAAGAEVLFMLPTAADDGMTAMLRVAGPPERFLQLRTTGPDMAVAEGDDIDPYLLRLAHASLDVLGRIGADRDNPTAVAEAIFEAS